MEFNTNMITKDGKKMMYLISIRVKEDCDNYDAIWAELERRMSVVSIPIVRVDWLLYDDSKKPFDFSKYLFYAQTLETGMGFVMSVLNTHEIRVHLSDLNFFNGDAYNNNAKKYKAEDTLEAMKQNVRKYHSDEIW